MSDWFQTAFGEDYIRLYAHRDDSEAAQVVELILTETGIGPGARVLDGPCGAGRHLKAFAVRGIYGYGFDLSTPLLAQAIRSGVPPTNVVRADLRRLPYREESFDLVVNLFSSLGYFESDEENLSVLHNLVSLCRHGGWIVVDFMNSDYVRTNLESKSSRVTADGLTVNDRRWIDGTPARVRKHTIVNGPDGSEKVFQESVRLFSPTELRTALSHYGIKVEAEFGSYAGEEFTNESKRIILMGRRTN